MKRLLIILLLSISLPSLGQRSVWQTQLTDTDRTLSIRIDGNIDGRKIHYDQTFNVAGMNSLQKDLLKYRVFASQGAPLPWHEMSGSIFAALAAFVLLITLGIVIYQGKKSRYSTS